MDVLEPVDGEQAVIDALPGLVVSGSLPETRPPVFLRVASAGGSQLNLVTDRQLLTLEAFGTTETSARLALAQALGRLHASATLRGELGSETCYGLNVVSLPQKYPLPTVPDRKRYVATIAADLRRRSVAI